MTHKSKKFAAYVFIHTKSYIPESQLKLKIQHKADGTDVYRM